MPRRVSLLIDDDLDKKLRALLIKKSKSEQRYISYSALVNECVKKGL